MSIRLPVIVTQSETRDVRAADIEESIVAELIMSEGLDATLIGPLGRIAADSTDMLCLRGFTHELALLAWIPIEQAAGWWQSQGLTGTLVPLKLAGQPASAAGIQSGPAIQAGRRINFCQLSTQVNPRDVRNALVSRLNDLRVKPVTIQLARPSTGSIGSGAVTSDPLPRPAVVAGNGSDLSRPSVSNAVPTRSDSGYQAVRPTNREPVDADEEFSELDHLVDDLEALDL